VTDELLDCWRDVKAPPHVRTYEGVRTKNGACEVRVTVGHGRPRALPKCLNVIRHSPTGFEWGYPGSGPAQLALAILMDALGKHQKERARRLHQAFKAAVIVNLPHVTWTLTSTQVFDAISRLEGPGRGGDRGDRGG
jgi:hypothetical protein